VSTLGSQRQWCDTKTIYAIRIRFFIKLMSKRHNITTMRRTVQRHIYFNTASIS
jgi:hypothetical protein